MRNELLTLTKQKIFSLSKILVIQLAAVVLLLVGVEIGSSFLLKKYGSFSNMRTELGFGRAENSRTRNRPALKHRSKFGHAPEPGITKEEWADEKFPIVYSKRHYSGGSSSFYRNLPFEIVTESGTIRRYRPGDHEIYHISIEIDSFGRRQFPQMGKRENKKYLLFIGCSFTFGDGLMGNQTIPYFTSAALPEYMAYNYGISGASTGHLLFRMKAIERAELPEKTGWVIYPFIDQHVSRLVGSSSILGHGNFDEHPHFYFDEKGVLQTDGSFKDVWPVWARWSRWFTNSSFAKFFGVDFPMRLEGKSLEFAAKIMKDMQDQAVQRLGAKGLIVLIWPGQNLSDALVSLLEAHGIRYLDYSKWDIEKMTKGPATIPYDWHPSAEANAVLGRSLAQEIKKIDLLDR